MSCPPLPVTTLTGNPFSDRPSSERIPLRPDTLARVVAQVTFNPIIKLRSTEGHTDFQDTIRRQYPHFFIDDTEMISEEAGGAQEIVRNSTAQFISSDRRSRATVNDTILSLETSHYTSREAFLESFAYLLDTFAKMYSPMMTGCGYRYINRLDASGSTGKDAETHPVSKYIRSELLGLRALDFGEDLSIESDWSRASLYPPEGHCLLQWGFFGPEQVHDPYYINPVDLDTWVLDIAVGNPNMNFDGDSLVEGVATKLTSMSERARAVFTWAVTDDYFEDFKRETEQ